MKDFNLGESFGRIKNFNRRDRRERRENRYRTLMSKLRRFLLQTCYTYQFWKILNLGALRETALRCTLCRCSLRVVQLQRLCSGQGHRLEAAGRSWFEE